MTIKGKRAKAVRKLPETALNRHFPRVYDDHLTADGAALAAALSQVAHCVDLHRLTELIEREVVEYREQVEEDRCRMSLAETRTWLSETSDLADELSTRLALVGHLHPAVYDETFCNVLFEHDLKEITRLHAIKAVSRHALTGLKGIHDIAGVPSKERRNCLLYIVAKHIEQSGVRKEAAAAVAAAVLRAFDIDAPEDPRKARAIVRRIENPETATN